MPTPAPPQYCPTPRELDDLELLTGGALAPTLVFDEPGSPVTLTLPADVEAQATAAGAVELVDPEGLPLALVTVPGGVVEPLARAQHGPFRRLYLSPAEVRERELEEVKREVSGVTGGPPPEDLKKRLTAAEKALEEARGKVTRVMVMQEAEKPRDSFVLLRGAYDKHGEKVSPGVPEVLPPLPADAPPNRLALARWLVDPSHPLTARVTVNRSPADHTPIRDSSKLSSFDSGSPEVTPSRRARLSAVTRR